METFPGIVVLILIAAVVIFIAGMINPSLIKKRSRSQVVLSVVPPAFAVFVVALILNDGKESDARMQVQAHDYTVISQDDVSIPARRRVRFTIIAPNAEAMTKEQRAELVSAVAIEQQKKTKAHLIDVWLEVSRTAAGKGRQLAMATYTPDGCGNGGDECDGVQWSVEASDYQLSPTEMQIVDNWYAMRDAFRKENGLVDEPALQRAIGEKLGFTAAAITMPWISLVKIK